MQIQIQLSIKLPQVLSRFITNLSFHLRGGERDTRLMKVKAGQFRASAAAVATAVSPCGAVVWNTQYDPI